jgi:GNAT superfamily N-acetyltransferase
MEEWTSARAGELHDLARGAFPAEPLTRADLERCCWDDPGIVLALAGGEGAASAVLRSWGDHRVGYLKLLAVSAAVRRRGLGRGLLEAAETWLFDQGAVEIRMGGSIPFYLWPGIDFRWTPALCLAESAGYRPGSAMVNMACSTAMHGVDAPEGVAIRRAVIGQDSAGALTLAGGQWPMWMPELQRGIDLGTAFVAVEEDGGGIVGFACHSINRAAWVGPMATDQARQRRGVGAALLSGLCRDLADAGYGEAEIGWVGPLRFYAKTAGAEVSRVFWELVKPKP